MIKCTKCHLMKSPEEFHNNKNRKNGKTTWCKLCRKEYHKDYYHNRGGREHEKDYYETGGGRETYKDYYHNRGGREKSGRTSMYEDKSCAQYLGIVVGERLCRQLFKDVEVMPHNNPGYDIICNKGKKIDVKTATITLSNDKYPRWQFGVNKNKIADYFICVAFDNIEDLNPIHMWMIPGDEINHLSGINIYLSKLHKWSQYEKDINDAQLCCTEMKGE